MMILLSGNILGQQQSAIFLEAASASGVQEMFYKNSIVKTNGSDILTCGATLNAAGNYDIFLTKHNASNVLQWSAQYAGSYGGNDFAADLAIDSQGNSIVTGTVQLGALDFDGVTIKYNSSGAQQWIQTYSGAGNGPDGFVTVTVDATDNIFVAGGYFASTSQLTNSVCVKYNASGIAQWANTWNNNTYNLQDAAARVVINGIYAYVYTATQIAVSPVAWKLARQQYVSSTGVLIPIRYYLYTSEGLYYEYHNRKYDIAQLATHL